MPHTDIAGYVYNFSYLGIFLWFAIIEQLTPIPEEVSLISLGYLSVHASLNPYLAGGISFLGLLSTDTFLFYISMKGSEFSKKLLAGINHKLLDKLKKKLHDNAGKTLFVMALLPKLRFLSPIISGAGEISLKFFLLINSIATMIYVVAYMLVGIFFYSQLNRILHRLKYIQNILFIVAMAVFAAYLIFVIRKMVFKKAH
jgi:membrane protein DedA with SNARE-associated domain